MPSSGDLEGMRYGLKGLRPKVRLSRTGTAAQMSRHHQYTTATDAHPLDHTGTGLHSSKCFLQLPACPLSTGLWLPASSLQSCPGHFCPYPLPASDPWICTHSLSFFSALSLFLQ